MTTEKKTKSKRGFAAMSPEKQREIASKGGKAAHVKGTAYQFTREKAREAGQKGGRNAQRMRAIAAGEIPEDRDGPVTLESAT